MERSNLNKEEIRQRLNNISQIRDLLFGDKIKAYEQNFEQLEERLEKVEVTFSQFQIEIRDRLTDLQDSLSTDIFSKIDGLEKKLKYLTLTTHEEFSNLKREIRSTVSENTQNIDSLEERLKTEINYLKNELAQTRRKQEKELQILKEQLSSEIEKKISQLTDTKVSRIDLAEILFELCLKMKGTELLQKESEAGIQTDLLLPEEKKD